MAPGDETEEAFEKASKKTYERVIGYEGKWSHRTKIFFGRFFGNWRAPDVVSRGTPRGK